MASYREKKIEEQATELMNIGKKWTNDGNKLSELRFLYQKFMWDSYKKGKVYRGATRVQIQAAVFAIILGDTAMHIIFHYHPISLKKYKDFVQTFISNVTSLEK